MTAVQQVFSELLALHPQLFNINSVEGREFVHHFHKYLDVEKQQIIDAYGEGFTEGCRYTTGFEQTLWEDDEDYYNQTYKSKQ
jgi:hypothetical protein